MPVNTLKHRRLLHRSWVALFRHRAGLATPRTRDRGSRLVRHDPLLCDHRRRNGRFRRDLLRRGPAFFDGQVDRV